MVSVARDRRSGFTLMELMMATFITILVMGGLCTFFLGAHRLVQGAYAESELSIQLRFLREKLLFHVAPPHNGKIWAGLLSGSSIGNSSVVESSFKVRMAANGIDLSSGVPCSQTIELIPNTGTSSDGSTARWFKNDGDRVDDQWQRPYLRPVSGYLPNTWLTDSEVAARNIFFVTLDIAMNGYRRGERLVIPVFGKVQEPGTGGVFHGH